MDAIRIVTTVETDGQLHFTGLPCRKGDRVEVVVLLLDSDKPTVRVGADGDVAAGLVRRPPAVTPELMGRPADRLSWREKVPEPPRRAVASDFGVYWKHFDREQRSDWPCFRWFTNSNRLAGELMPGDRLWLISSGENCGVANSRLGYLVEIFVVERVESNRGRNADYPTGDFAYTIVGEKARCLAVNPPLLVDAIIRTNEATSDLPIGTVRQGSWKLNEQMTLALHECFRKERNDLYRSVFGGDE